MDFDCFKANGRLVLGGCHNFIKFSHIESNTGAIGFSYLMLSRSRKTVILLDYIYMTNLPICMSIIYFLIGFGLNVISYNIAINNFQTKKAPLVVMLLIYLVSNIVMIALLSLISTHIGIYFLVSILIPYVAVWRTSF